MITVENFSFFGEKKLHYVVIRFEAQEAVLKKLENIKEYFVKGTILSITTLSDSEIM